MGSPSRTYRNDGSQRRYIFDYIPLFRPKHTHFNTFLSQPTSFVSFIRPKVSFLLIFLSQIIHPHPIKVQVEKADREGKDEADETSCETSIAGKNRRYNPFTSIKGIKKVHVGAGPRRIKANHSRSTSMENTVEFLPKKTKGMLKCLEDKENSARYK